ncbi:MAG: diaminohydroxyphosphoribosylaminopyrimidine deaminase [Parcubacteria group bacterium]|nr:diaminohydroxyphosphoribosylaminopyrimidine deaminase [Parcubacteria group bacterium]
MNEKAIFEHLFAVASQSQDPRGVVSACVVLDGQIVASAASSNDGIRHAEDVLFEDLKKNGIALTKNHILYATLEPCTKRSFEGLIDCTTQIIESGIGKVVFGARDPGQSIVTQKRLSSAGIEIHQTADADIVKHCAEIFNSSVTPEHAGVDVTLKPLE